MNYKLLADATNDVIGNIIAPQQINSITSQGGAGGLSSVINSIINIIYTFGTIAVIFMILIAAFEWITSGGDKDAVAKARARLTYAVIGLLLLALTFVILNVLGGITHFTFFNGQTP